MYDTQRVALAQRTARAEAELLEAQQDLDGSPASRTRYARAQAEYRHAEQLALAVLGARDALKLVEAQHAVAHEMEQLAESSA